MYYCTSTYPIFLSGALESNYLFIDYADVHQYCVLICFVRRLEVATFLCIMHQVCIKLCFELS
jgi:hypothetical protein